jgi:hypothetical protein
MTSVMWVDGQQTAPIPRSRQNFRTTQHFTRIQTSEPYRHRTAHRFLQLITRLCLPRRCTLSSKTASLIIREPILPACAFNRAGARSLSETLRPKKVPIVQAWSRIRKVVVSFPGKRGCFAWWALAVHCMSSGCFTGVIVSFCVM